MTRRRLSIGPILAWALGLGGQPSAGMAATTAPAPVVAAPAGAASFRDCPDCPEMVVVPAGRFRMGSGEDERRREGVPAVFAAREVPQHEVVLAKPFALSRFEVTRALYARFVAETRRPDPPGCGVFDAKTDSWGRKPGYSWRDTGFKQADDEPAACISWRDAADFAAWLAAKTGKPYRLASEAEGEYAARGGTATTRYWGDSIPDICGRANIMTSGTVRALGAPKSWTDKLVCSSPTQFTQPVGRYAPNPFGLYDMLGNVFEWVSDCYHETYEGAPADGSSWDEPGCQFHAPRGGAFHSLPWLARPAFRGGKVPADYNPVAAGARVARDLD